MPGADAGVGLPGFGADAGGNAALDILGRGRALGGLEVLGVHHRLVFAAVARRVRVVVMRDELEADLLEGDALVVEIEQVGLVFVDEVLRAEEPVVGVAPVERRDLLPPVAVHLAVPVERRFRVGNAGRHGEAEAAVQVLRVEPLPPLALAVGLGEGGRVIGHSRQRSLPVVVIGGLEPVPCVRGVVGHAEAQAVGAGQLGPGADDVLLRADIDRVPRVILRIVGVKVVVVVGQRDEVLGAGPHVELHQFFRVPLLGLPEIVELHEAELRRMAVVLEVVFIVLRALEVHLARIPVALLGHALGGPVGPDAELRVAEPVGRLVVRLQRFPGGLERTRGDDAGGGRRGRRGDGRRRGDRSASDPFRREFLGGEVGDGAGELHLVAREFAAISDPEIQALRSDLLRKGNVVPGDLPLEEINHALVAHALPRGLARELAALGLEVVDVFLQADLAVEFRRPLAVDGGGVDPSESGQDRQNEAGNKGV